MARPFNKPVTATSNRKVNKALRTWVELHKQLPGMSVEEVNLALATEHAGLKRKSFLQRLAQRAGTLAKERAQRLALKGEIA